MILKINIVRVSGSYYPAKKMGGAATADYEIDKGLSKLGYKVVVLTTKAGLEGVDVKRVDFEKNMKIKFFNIYGNFNYFISPGLVIFFIFKVLISKTFRNSHFIFSGTWGVTSIFTMLVCKIFKLNYSVITHGSLYPELIEKRKPKIKKLLSGFLTPILNAASFVHYTVTNEKLSAKSIHTQQKNAVVIPLGLDYSHFYSPNKNDIKLFFDKYHMSNEKKIILFVGRLNWKKGLDKLLCALDRVDTNYNYQFVCVGPEDTGYLDDLKKQIPCTAFDRINYIGPLYGDDLSIAYASSDIFALTSYSENFAMTIIEASYYNNAIFMTDKVGVSEFYSSDNAMISTINDEDIFDNLFLLLNNQSLISRLTYNAKENCKQFNINNMLIKLCENIQK